MDSREGSQASVAKPGRGRGLMLRSRSKKTNSDSGIGQSIDTNSSKLIKSCAQSVSSVRSPANGTYSLDGATDTSNDFITNIFRSESCTPRDIEGTFSSDIQQLKEALPAVPTEQQNNISAFSNTNCLQFKENTEVTKLCYHVEFTSHEDYELFPIQKKQFFLQEFVKDALELPAYYFELPDKLYTVGPLPQDHFKLQGTIDSHQVTVSFELSSNPINQKEFFDVLLQKIALMITSPKAFVPLQLTPEYRRFERYPGKVIDVVKVDENDLNDHRILVRCSSNPVNTGTVRDIISECLIYAISEGVDEKYYHRLVLDSLKNLVVLADIEKTILIISDVLWDQNMRKSHHRQSFFERRGVRVQPRPILVCRYLHKETTTHMEAENLRIQGSRRTKSSHLLGRDHAEGGADCVSNFLGEPVSGQQRQLALLRYLESATKKRIVNELAAWGLQLLDTAVVSNGVLLQSDQMLHLAKNCYAPVQSRGWLARLADFEVTTPVRISSWVVVAQRGDENIVIAMIENLINDAPKLGIQIDSPRMAKYILSDERKAYVQALKALQGKHKDLQLAIVIMRASRDDIYCDVKKWALMSQNRNIATQVLIRDTARAVASRPQVCLSIITQINCKMGGDLWTLDGTLTGIMVIGMSAYTGTSGFLWLGVVASRDRLFSRWYSTAIKDMQDLKIVATKALAKYREANKDTMPETTFVFRRQMAPLSQREKADLQGACGPNTSLVVVTLLDTVELVDIFMTAAKSDDCATALTDLHKKLIYVPQQKGVPTDVLVFLLECNTAQLSIKVISKVIKQLKHMYFNVAGETSLPAPLLYASKCAEFVADVLEDQPEERVEDLLYYL
ncbi:piwi-like protein 1 isoform X2 [Varroa destructor]|uniref:Piwi domain-containing protein n=1 Tax=Varroa destructor TaxID=109461 RepID=A0A7M7KN77_VARDE|nr:piwi-like protein 1 isoform X2 [Varroa destructor]